MKRKYPRLPNGMGSIKYLGKGRSNPYGVYAPEYKLSNKSICYPKAICYVDDWYVGFAVLVAYKAGAYHPGDEVEISRQRKSIPDWEMSDLSKKILADYRSIGAKKEEIQNLQKHKFKDLYEAYMEKRFGQFATAPFAEHTVDVYEDSYNRLQPIHDRYIEDLKVDDIQDVINKLAIKYSKSTLSSVLNVCSNVFVFAIDHEYVPRNLCSSVKIPIIAKDSKQTNAYTDDDLAKLWAAARSGDRTAIQVIIQTYTGFRVGAMYDMEVDLKNRTIYGGVKTGKRTVPIHPAIMPLLQDLNGACAVPCCQSYIGKRIIDLCKSLGIEPIYKSHSARHTFKRLCDKYDVNPLASRLLMGHSLNTSDIHDAVYTHWDIEDLRREIEKIQVPE